MLRQGRILIVDNLVQWCEELVETLQHHGFHADSASTVNEALERLNEHFYHTVVIDIRMNETDQSNKDGIELLSKMEKSGLSEATKVIMLSAYGTQEQMRLAFKDYKVADFLTKDEFSKQAFLESVQQVFSRNANINLALDILWQSGSRSEQVVLNLEVGGTRVKRGTHLQTQMAAELEDLLCRLFYQAKGILVRPLTPGQSGTGILRIQPFYSNRGIGREVIVKFGDFNKIQQEHHNFKEYVEPFIGGGRSTIVLDVRRTAHLGGIIYSLLGTNNDQLVDFGEFYRDSNASQITEMLDRVFLETCGPWYDNHEHLQLLNLTVDYQRLFGYTPKQLEHLRSKQLKSVQGKQKLRFTSLKSERTFTNPLLVMAGQPLARPTYTCITHGDFNPHNLLVDNIGHVWLISLLLTSLREQRCLLILDNFESVLSAGQSAGQYRQGYEDYGRLLRLIGEADHASCLLLTSREKPREVARMEGKASAVRTLQLGGLSRADGQQLLKDRELFGPDAVWATFIRLYSGNPLALKLIAESIREVFGGNIAKFIEERETVFGDLETLLEEQFTRLGELEQILMYWLAIERQAVSLHELRANILHAGPKGAVLEAVDSLRRRSLIETRDDGRLTLQPVIMEYVTGKFVERIFEELVTEKVEVFESHALMQAAAKDYVRRNQERFILTAVVERLITTFGKTGSEEKLQHILSILHSTHAEKPGYAAGNILNLLVKLQADLRGADFSSLAVGQAYLQGANLADVNFARADLMTSVFTDTFSSILCVALSANGKLLAAGTTTGEVRLWLAESLTPLFICAGHADGIRSVAFSPDGWTIASGSEDKTIRTWDATMGRCLSTLDGHRGWVRSVAFSIDGNILASGGDDATVRLWETSTGKSLNILRAHSKAVRAVTFSSDGGILASGSEDTTIRMWDFSTGDCFLILHGHTDFVRAMAFSPDGTLLASSSDDQTISLWDSKTGSSLKVLHPQSNRIWSLAFLPNSKTLVSASESVTEDETLQYWEVRSGQCIRKLRGYSSLIKSVAFSPNGTMVASGSEDETVRVWDIKSGQCLKILRGHTHLVRSVTFNAEGSLIASASHDQTIRIWDAKTGQCLKILQEHNSVVWCASFSPDANLIVSGHDDTLVCFWDTATGTCLKTLKGHTQRVWSVAFSPDGRMIASSSDDGTIKLWGVDTGACIKTLQSDRPYERMNITHARGLTEAQKTSLKMLGAIEDMG